MKSKFLIVALFVVAFSSAQENQTLRMGVQFGLAGNKSKFTGGMSDADARFVYSGFGAGALSWILRYDYNERWKIESGFCFSNLGFEYKILQDYSFLKPRKGNNFSKSSVGTFEIPVMVSYKFKPNCRNAKWFVGAGFANVFVGKNVKLEQAVNTEDLPMGSSGIENKTTVNSGLYFHPRFTIGRERTLKNGHMISAAMIWNFGSSVIANSKVEYQNDSKSYNHEFTNRGNFVGFRFTYFFKAKDMSKM